MRPFPNDSLCYQGIEDLLRLFVPQVGLGGELIQADLVASSRQHLHHASQSLGVRDDGRD